MNIEVIRHFFFLLLIVFGITLVGRVFGRNDLAIAAGMVIGVGVYVLVEVRHMIDKK